MTKTFTRFELYSIVGLASPLKHFERVRFELNHLYDLPGTNFPHGSTIAVLINALYLSQFEKVVVLSYFHSSSSYLHSKLKSWGNLLYLLNQEYPKENILSPDDYSRFMPSVNVCHDHLYFEFEAEFLDNPLIRVEKVEDNDLL